MTSLSVSKLKNPHSQTEYEKPSLLTESDVIVKFGLFFRFYILLKCCTQMCNPIYSCECVEGFRTDGKLCVNLNECDGHENPCHVNAICHDEHGTFWCECRDGFKGNGRECYDIDECAQHIHECKLNSNCNNNDGSYTCKCEDGYNDLD